MNNNTSTITIPKWFREITKTPQKYINQMFKTLAFLKIKEYERQLQSFKEKYKVSFERFEQKAKSQKKESFKMWDDYLIWKGTYLAYQKWLKRYKRI